ncbi:MAG: NAD(P)H-dependent oxidoreductase [Verrucomicrobiota bacterium]
MKILVLSCSGNADSRSRRLAHEAMKQLEAISEVEAELVDLQALPLPFCDAGAAYGHENVAALSEKAAAAHGFLIAAPIYNFDVNAICKNVIELTGRQMSDKVIGFLCTAGGEGSYMSIMPLANSLMLDFRCLIVPRFVYATGKHFNDANELADADLKARIKQLAQATAQLAGAYQPVEKE